MALEFLRRRSGRGHALDQAGRADRAQLLRRAEYELVPLASATAAIAELPPAAEVTITCSPVKGIGATLDLAGEVAALGHRVTPHLAARMVEGHEHVDRIVHRLDELAITEVFVIAGDTPEPAGPYHGAAPLIETLLDKAPFLAHVGFAGYPDGHAFVDPATVHAALHHKRDLLRSAGVEGHVSTQMCFDAGTIRDWIVVERRAGFDLPVHLGVAGVVDRARLLTMGMRLGVGTSLRYLSKNRRALARLMTPSSYSPGDVVDALAGDLATLGITGLHVFTFNQVAATRGWLDAET